MHSPRKSQNRGFVLIVDIFSNNNLYSNSFDVNKPCVIVLNFFASTDDDTNEQRCECRYRCGVFALKAPRTYVTQLPVKVPNGCSL